MTWVRIGAASFVALAIVPAVAGAHDGELTAAQAPAPPRPLPEVLAFETPRSGATTSSEKVAVTGTVVTDATRAVRGVKVELRHPTTGAVVAAEAAPVACIENCKTKLGSRTHRFGPITLSALREGNNVLRAAALLTDGRTLTGTTTIVRKDARPNLFLKALEINQGQRVVFDTNASPSEGRPLHTATSLAPAIGGRATVVRAYPGSSGDPVAGVTGLLFGTRGGQPLPGSPLRPASPVTALPRETLDAQAADAGRTLNFVLPPSWTEEGADTTRLTLDLNSSSLREEEIVPECGTCRNSADKIDIRTPTWLPGPAELRIIPHRTPTTPTSIPESRMFDAIARMFPIDPADIVIEPLPAHVNIFRNGCGAIDDVMQGRISAGNRGLHYAVTEPTNGCAGVAYFGAPWGAGLAGGMDGEFGDHTVAQELGHELGLDHAGCAHGEQSVLGCSLYPHPHGGIGTPGFDVERMLAIPPGNPVFTTPADAHMHDFMSYGAGAQPALPNVWVAQDTWTDLRAALLEPGTNPGALAPRPPPGPAPPVPPPPANQPNQPPPTPTLGPGKLVAIGAIAPDTGLFTYVLDSAGIFEEVPPEPSEPSGDYEMRALGPAGNIVDQRFFSTAQDTSHTGLRPVFAIFEDGASIVRVELLHNGTVVDVRVGSPNQPDVLWTDPAAAKVDAAGATPPNSGKRTVSWTSSDADGDRLSYNVEFSRDGGRTYQVIQAGIPGLKSTVDLADLPSTPNGRFRVTAFDGFHTRFDPSNRTIAIGNHRPKPFVIAPEAGSVAAAGSTVVLTGFATDVDEGTFDTDGLAWTSSRDGELGSGINLGAPRLSIGRHRITLTARDTEGATARRSTTIRVVPGADDGRAPRVTRVARRGRTVTLRFSEDVVGIGTRSLRVRDARGRALAATVSYDARTRTATLRARRGTPARVSAGGSISDLGGRRLRKTSRGFR